MISSGRLQKLVATLKHETAKEQLDKQVSPRRAQRHSLPARVL